MSLYHSYITDVFNYQAIFREIIFVAPEEVYVTAISMTVPLTIIIQLRSLDRN